ncbi:alpha/beta hydrolase [Agrobacterium larrymoorei]|uniref:Alpha/beta-hydrolase family protein n=1 Tax=Agrobacterium larrymoorei TaxID=160699 RepID=A0AAF0H9Z4_9HYPH|nr:alpha/beta-hydrolase family protein [Agrobacterium larrymoorei]WHA40431.1 alpha/beta-hydrolase family protein [Agrobacterium larrymoorei]
MPLRWIRRLVVPLSSTGIVFGTVLFCASLTPSLLPRTFVMQGVLCGFSFAIGYLIGVLLKEVYLYLGLPHLSRHDRRGMRFVVTLAAIVAAVGFLWQAATWQNSIRVLMELDPLDSGHPFRTGAIAIVVAALLIGITRFFQLVRKLFALRSRRFLPRRLANVVGIFAAVALAWMLVNGLIFDIGLRFADSSLKQVDSLIEPDVPRPSDPMKTGSGASLMTWESLGRRGREFVATGPTASEISTFTHRQAMEPIRVYAGLNSAETPAARAKLALEELKRAGGFQRKTLLVVVPTGTGWIDPEALDTVEYLHSGDIASVAVQYSYLSSWIALLTEPDYGVETARALFEEIYGYWTTLPKESRPKLYLHGLSLGALNSQKSSDLYDVLADPFQGALWSGPPFSSPTWRMATNGRLPGTPQWLPKFRDSSVIRFADQYQNATMPNVPWGPMRIVYLQYASDPITFFETSSLYRRPQWMNQPRGRDVSTSFRWFPVVTSLQLALDVAAATTAPMGYGHVYAPEHYIDAWMEVTAPEGWNAEELQRLKMFFKAKRGSTDPA